MTDESQWSEQRDVAALPSFTLVVDTGASPTPMLEPTLQATPESDALPGTSPSNTANSASPTVTVLPAGDMAQSSAVPTSASPVESSRASGHTLAVPVIAVITIGATVVMALLVYAVVRLFVSRIRNEGRVYQRTLAGEESEKCGESEKGGVEVEVKEMEGNFEDEVEIERGGRLGMSLPRRMW